jgi:hypothetical protein
MFAFGRFPLDHLSPTCTHLRSALQRKLSLGIHYLPLPSTEEFLLFKAEEEKEKQIPERRSENARRMRNNVHYLCNFVYHTHAKRA